MDLVMRGEATAAQIGALLIALRMKGETAEEIAGFAEAMRSHVVPVVPERPDVIDTAGTGGDNAHTINLSTAAALVADSSARTQTAPLRIFLRGGPKTHGPATNGQQPPGMRLSTS